MTTPFQLTRITDLDKEVKYIMVVGLIAAPACFLFWTDRSVTFLMAIDHFLSGNSLYALTNCNAPNPHCAHYWPYMPSLAMFVSILVAPVKLAIGSQGSIIFPESGGLMFDYVYTLLTLLMMSVWGWLSLVGTSLVARDLFDENRREKIAVIMLLTFPLLWMNALYSTYDSLVLLFALVGIVFAHRGRWMLAGVFVGTSMFKFTAVPLGVVLFFYAWLNAGQRSAASVAVGGVLSQIPNLLYFVLYPSDLFLILQKRGALAALAHTYGESQVFLRWVQLFNLEQWYINIGFPLVMGAFTLIGLTLALRTPGGLPLGFAVAFFPATALVPAIEQRVLPFVVLIALCLIPIVERTRAKVVLGTVWFAAFYEVLSKTVDPGVANGLAFDPLSIYAHYFYFIVIAVALLFTTYEYYSLDRSSVW